MNQSWPLHPAPPVEPSLATLENEATRQTRRLRWMEWGLVMAVAFWEPLFSALYTLLPMSGGKVPRSAIDPSIGAGLSCVRDLVALALLVYVLFRQGRNLRSIGFRWQWSDIPISFGLMLLAMGARVVFLILVTLPLPNRIEFLKHLQPANIPDFHVTLLPLLMMIVNPFYEELLLRAFTQTEVTALTNRAWLAAIMSVSIQISFHFYQGIVIALTYIPIFGTLAVYYLLKRRITPVILCHMYFDVTALIFLSQITKHAQ